MDLIMQASGVWAAVGGCATAAVLLPSRALRLLTFLCCAVVA